MKNMGIYITINRVVFYDMQHMVKMSSPRAFRTSSTDSDKDKQAARLIDNHVHLKPFFFFFARRVM
jgi:hypothetical protein